MSERIYAPARAQLLPEVENHELDQPVHPARREGGARDKSAGSDIDKSYGLA
jgi:hypothetical protein